jgi:hypothetical protein
MRMNSAGTPSDEHVGRTSFVTTAPAPTIAPWPIVTSAPSHTWPPPVSAVSD